MSTSRIPERRSFWTDLRTLAFEREYCEWATPYLGWLRRPLGVLAMLALFSLLCGLFVAPQGFVMLAAILAVILVGCVWPWIGIRGVSCELRFAASRTEEGRPVDVELILNNRWPWPVWGLAVEGGFGAAGDNASSPEVAIARAGGWSKGHFHWQFSPSVRGRYPLEKPQLVTEFPFGLWKASKPVEVLSQLIVWPKRFTLPPLVLASGTQSWTGQASECTEGNIGHRSSVREYRLGDSMRQIHWAKTAMYDKLVSYEREGLAVSEATVSVDTHPSLHRGRGAESSVEWTIRIAASVCETLVRQGVSVAIFSHADHFGTQRSGQHATPMLDWFALLNTELDAPDDGRMTPQRRNSTALTIHITTDRCRKPVGESIVFVTDREQEGDVTSTASKNCWIELSLDADIPSQVRRGWRNGQRKRSYAR